MTCQAGWILLRRRKRKPNLILQVMPVDYQKEKKTTTSFEWFPQTEGSYHSPSMLKGDVKAKGKLKMKQKPQRKCKISTRLKYCITILGWWYIVLDPPVTIKLWTVRPANQSLIDKLLKYLLHKQTDHIWKKHHACKTVDITQLPCTRWHDCAYE